MANPSNNSPVAEQVKDMLSSDTTPVATKTAKVTLAALDTAGGVLAWQNPETSKILVLRILIRVTTKSTAACTIDIGKAANGTTSADTFMDGLDVGTAAGLFDNVDDKGTNGSSQQELDEKGGTNDYITASKATGAAAGLVGSAFISYVEV